ncbi:VOC family protein [Nonomuraea sp. NPDC049269]|uniref:VOC family protein n=1 Tax=Nonomuraea sp. NPDC049269 TaxID=3364349 RepID=UPI0037193A1F
MNLNLSSCALAVHDVDEALGFYRDVLGFEVRDDGEFERTRWVRVGPPSQPDVQIFLESPGADLGVPPADQQAIEGLLGRLVFVTDNCDATFEHIEAAGAEVMQEPIDQPNGVRDCAFLDPSGNMLRFTQPGSAGEVTRVKALKRALTSCASAKTKPCKWLEGRNKKCLWCKSKQSGYTRSYCEQKSAPGKAPEAPKQEGILCKGEKAGDPPP